MLQRCKFLYAFIALLVIIIMGCSCSAPSGGGSGPKDQGGGLDDGSGDGNTPDNGGDDSGDDGLAPPTPAQIPTSIEGIVQKGPFIQGQTITISELDSDFNPTGTNYEIETEDNSGNFLLDQQLENRYVQITGDGYYFNEVAGDEDGPITLRSVSDVVENDNIKVNILTTLARKRIIYLISNEEASFTEARTQAQEEVLDLFHISGSELSDFDEMDISQSGTSNAILLAVSVMLQGDSDAANLSDLISGIGNDLEENGEVNNGTYLENICDNSRTLNFDEIRDNLEARYDEIDVSATIPPFEDYIDSDCDGTINKDDDVTYLWFDGGQFILNGTTCGNVFNVTVFNEKVWFSHQACASANNIYSSEDGINFDLVTDDPGWNDINVSCLFTFNDELWFADCETGEGSGGIWHSTDGTDWTLVTDVFPWEEDDYYSRLFMTSFNDEIWAVEQEWDHNNIWHSSDGETWTEIDDPDPEEAIYVTNVLVADDALYIFGYRMMPSYLDYVYSTSDGETWNVDHTLFAVTTVDDSIQWMGAEFWMAPLSGHQLIRTSADGLEEWSILNPSPVFNGVITETYKHLHTYVFDNKFFVVINGTEGDCSGECLTYLANYADQ